MGEGRRVHRVAEKVRQIIARELQEASDPRFQFVTITSARVSKDLRNAKVYWVVSAKQAATREEVEKAFQGAEGRFKKALSKELGTRQTPNLSFYYDDSLDTAEQVESLLNQALRG